MGIQKLSQELWDHIALAAHECDWKRLRLVCKSFEHQAAACLFSHLTVCLQQKSLDGLVGIAGSIRLGHHVRSLTIGDEIFSKHAQVTPAAFITGLQKIHLGITPPAYQHHRALSWEEYQRVTIDDFPEAMYPQGLNKIGLNRHVAFCSYIESGDLVYQHSQLIKQNLDIWYLAAAFSKLENLTTVHLSISNKANREWSWGSTSDCAYILTPGEYQDRQLQVFFGAAACSAGLKITNFNIDDAEEHLAVATNRGLGEISTYLISAALPSLRSITCLDIPIGDISESTDSPHGLATLRIAELLRGLPCLEKFSLRNNKGYGSFRVKVASILAAISSNRLQSINMEGCLYHAHRFKAFLMKHGTTLRKIGICKGFLVGCTLESLFRFMHNRLMLEELVLNSSLIELKDEGMEHNISMEFMRASNHNARSAISAFVTRKSDHYPSNLVEKASCFITLASLL